MINAFNYTSGVLPVTKADKNVDVRDTTYQPSSDLDKRNWDACKRKLPDSLHRVFPYRCPHPMRSFFFFAGIVLTVVCGGR